MFSFKKINLNLLYLNSTKIARSVRTDNYLQCKFTQLKCQHTHSQTLTHRRTRFSLSFSLSLSGVFPSCDLITWLNINTFFVSVCTNFVIWLHFWGHYLSLSLSFYLSLSFCQNAIKYLRRIFEQILNLIILRNFANWNFAQKNRKFFMIETKVEEQEQRMYYLWNESSSFTIWSTGYLWPICGFWLVVAIFSSGFQNQLDILFVIVQFDNDWLERE